MSAPAPLPPRRPVRALLAAAAAAALGAAAALAVEGPADPVRATVEDMDMGLLQRNLLKLYVCESESGINARSLAKYRASIQEAGDPRVESLRRPTPEEMDLLRQRQKEIFHYLLMEKTNAIQMVHIVDRVLGTDVHLAGEGRLERAILEKRVELIEIPRGTEIRTAGQMIAEVLGCTVRVETVETEINRLFFTMGPTTGEAIIKQVCSLAPYTYRIEGGALVFRHRDLPASGEGKPARPDLGGGDDGE